MNAIRLQIHRLLTRMCLLCVLSAAGGCALPTGEAFDPYAYSSQAAVYGSEADGSQPQFQAVTRTDKLSPGLLQAPGQSYKVGPGDVLEIEIADQLGTRSDSVVLPDGMLYFDLAEGVRAEGLTLTEVSSKLQDALVDHYASPVVSVNLKEAHSRRFWLLGQVKKPGAYPIMQDMTLVEALSHGGGLYSGELQGNTQEIGDLRRSLLVRDGKALPIDFENLVERGDMSQNVFIRPGDYIYVASVQDSAVYVLGSVKKPGPVYFLNSISAVGALAEAGGTDPRAIVTKALVIRGSLSHPQVAVVNLQDLMHGRARDFELMPGDILWVPQSNWTYVDRYVSTILSSAAQAVAIAQGYRAVGLNPDGSSLSIGAGGL